MSSSLLREFTCSRGSGKRRNTVGAFLASHADFLLVRDDPTECLRGRLERFWNRFNFPSSAPPPPLLVSALYRARALYYFAIQYYQKAWGQPGTGYYHHHLLSLLSSWRMGPLILLFQAALSLAATSASPHGAPFPYLVYLFSSAVLFCVCPRLPM